jgi:EAL domain-containing protein (putative c-di-GMP-specific phosphodiesterase class I)
MHSQQIGSPAHAADPLAPLREALQRDGFSLYCQPILSLANHRFEMAEVLVRLREEEQSMLPPGEFLPLFEESGMMPQLDLWVVRHSLRRLAAGLSVKRLTVNVSGQTLRDPGFPKAVAAELGACKVARGRLAFEIDEADLVSHTADALRFGAAVKGLGCGVIVDGFGERATGPVVKVLQPSLVKVYGGIVRTLLTRDESADKFGALAHFCASLGIGMIAECVEDRNVLTGLKALGVGYAQGFGIEVPKPIEALA